MAKSIIKPIPKPPKPKTLKTSGKPQVKSGVVKKMYGKSGL